MTPDISLDNSATMGREFDLIVFGSTGDSGRATAAYLARVAPKSIKWAIAGRSLSKLEALREVLQLSNPDAAFGTIVASCEQNGGLLEMARRTRLVLSTAGPYAKLGEPVVAACIDAGTLYVDITGELPWVAAMRTRYPLPGVCLCSFAGYDCVPAELSVFIARQHLGGAKLTSAECVFELAAGGAPRGTLLSILFWNPLQFAVGMLSYMPAAERRATCFSLLLWLLPWWSAHVGAFTVPHFMGWCNTPVIHSSCAALGTGGLRYQDRQLLSSSLLSLYGLVPLVFSYTVVLALAPFALPWLLMMVAFPLVGEPSTQPSRSPPPTLKLTTLTLDMPVVLALAFCGSWLSVHRSSQARPRTLILTLPRSGGCPPVCSNRSTRTVARKRRASRCTHVPQLRAAPRPTSPLYVQATLASIARPCSRRRPRSRCSMRRRFQRDGRAPS